MAEEKETGFKITDKRKFNPDGTPREQEIETKMNATGEVQKTQTAEDASSNVVSFDAAKKERVESQPAPEAGSATSATSPQKGREAPANAQSAAAEKAYNQAAGPKSAQLPEASFLSLVNMLAVEAAMNLGMIRSPEGAPQIDLESARHMIDMLGMLQQKTRGNLTAEEDNLLDSVLADLRMQFVALSKRR